MVQPETNEFYKILIKNQQVQKDNHKNLSNTIIPIHLDKLVRL